MQKKIAEHEKIAADLQAQEEAINKVAKQKLAEEKSADSPINTAQEDTEKENAENKKKLAQAEVATRKAILGGNVAAMRTAAGNFRDAQNPLPNLQNVSRTLRKMMRKDWKPLKMKWQKKLEQLWEKLQIKKQITKEIWQML